MSEGQRKKVKQKDGADGGRWGGKRRRKGAEVGGRVRWPEKEGRKRAEGLGKQMFGVRRRRTMSVIGNREAG